jgi:hypothetical protein
MSENSKELRELLIELEYGELDQLEAVEVQERIDADPAMVAMQTAFRAVRADLRADDHDQPIDVRPARIAFVGMPGQPATNSWSVWFKGAAVAASFAFGLLLAAAAANTFGLMPVAPLAAPGTEPLAASPSAPISAVAQMSPDLENYLDSRYARREAVNTVPVSQLTRAELTPIIDDLMAEREAQLQQMVQQMLAVATDQQRQEIETMMTGAFQTFDAQRTNDMLAVADQLGILQQNTGLELQRNTEAIDYLFTRVSDAPTIQRERNDD